LLEPGPKKARFTRDEVTITVMLVAQAASLFAAYLPSWFTVSSPFFHEQAARKGNIKRIRWGEAAATTVVMGTGWAVGARSSTGANNLPLLASAVISAGFVAGYEYMIKHPAVEDGNEMDYLVNGTKADIPAFAQAAQKGSKYGYE
jgi:hypothetical protein